MVLKVRDRYLEWDRPVVMGIVNLTPDSFYADSRVDLSVVCRRVKTMLAEGADIIDLGACSTRPGFVPSSPDYELSQLVSAVKKIRSEFGNDVLLSIDTFRANVARECIVAGADIINDISGGDADTEMFDTLAELRVPYILTHDGKSTANQRSGCETELVAAEVLGELAAKLARLHQLGVADVIVDPGFGFGKSLNQNYELMSALPAFKALEVPILVGISRKSMIHKELRITPEEALNGTTALNMMSLMQGADILRIHDVKPAVETVKLYMAFRRNKPSEERLIETFIATTR